MFAKEQIPYVPISQQQLLQRPLETVQAYAIDGPGTRVVDDAISVHNEYTKNGTQVAFINTYIADTALIGISNSVFERAKNMGQTIYSGNKTVHMMPDEVINQLSLGNGGELGSPAIAVKLKIQADRVSILGISRVRVKVSNTDYEQFALFYKNGDNTDVNEIVEAYNMVKGNVSIYGADVNSHDVVATYMRLTNLSLARYAMINCMPWIYRSKKEGYCNRNNIKQARRAHYTHRPRLHQGIGKNLVYCHGASPLRRFADHVDQLTLVAHLEGQTAPFDANDMREFSIELNKRTLHSIGLSAVNESICA